MTKCTNLKKKIPKAVNFKIFELEPVRKKNSPFASEGLELAQSCSLGFRKFYSAIPKICSLPVFFEKHRWNINADKTEFINVVF